MEESYFTYAKNLTFFICFIISFVLMEGPKSMETIGIILFLAVHFIFSLSFGKDIMGFFMAENQSIEYRLRLWSVFISVVLSVAAAVMFALTIAKLQSTFAASGSPIHLNESNREKLDKMETIFITVVVFLGTMGLNVYFTPESLFKFMFEVLRTAANIGQYLMIVLPFICFGVGSALYERMRMFCDSDNIQSFKSNFHTTYWLLFGVIGLLLFKRVMEWLVFPYFRKVEHTLLLNPTIFGSLMGSVIPLLIAAVFFVMYMVNLTGGKGIENANTITYVIITGIMVALGVLNAAVGFKWDMFMDLTKWALSIAAVVFAGFTIRDYIGMNKRDGCFKHDLANLYVIFITCLFIIFFLTIITPLQLTQLVTMIVRYLVPPTTLALTAYLVYLSNDMAHLSKTDLVA